MNLGQIRTALQALGYGSDTASVQTEFINDAYRHVAGLHRWPWLEAQGTLVTVIGQANVSVAPLTLLREIDAVRCEVGTDYVEIEYRMPQDLRDLEHVDRVNQRPLYWTFINGALRLYPAPDKVYTLTVDYLTTISTLTADADTPAFAPEFHDILKWQAAEQMAYRDRDWWAMNFGTERGAARLAEMERHYGIRQRQTASEVVHHKFWSGVGRQY